MATFVKFPGTAGNYVSTDDLNLLNSNQAHIFQGTINTVQNWPARSQADNLTKESDPTATVGGFALQFLAAAPTTNCSVRTSTPTNGPTVAGDTVYTAIIRARTLGGIDRTAFVVIDFHQGATYLSSATMAGITLPADGSWVDVIVTGTSHVDADNALAYLRIGDAVDNEPFRIDRACFRLGSDSSFEPSLRILGDLFEETDPPTMPVGFAADGTPLTVGASWAGDGYSYRRYDGANNLAPLVCSFSADDVPVP